MRTKWKNVKTTIKCVGDEYPWVGTITSIFREGDSLWYSVKVDNETDPIAVQVDFVEWIRPLAKAKIIPFTRRLKAVR